jgi:hypothetical protein
MRTAGAEPSFVRRLLPWLGALLILALFGAATMFLRQQDTGRRTAEARADSAEAQLADAQASLTALVRAVASVTAIAEANQPGTVLHRYLDLVLAAYQKPDDARLKALAEAFGPDALAVERPEAEHLISGAMHLGGASGYTMDVLSTNQTGPGQAEVRTHEQWTYDEVDANEKRSRCVREDSEQTYTMHQTPAGLWMVDDVQIEGVPRRTDC